MNELLPWMLMTIAWAGAFLLLALWRLPIIIMRRYVEGFGKRIGTKPWNKLYYPGPVNAKEDAVVTTSPDMLVMFGVYDSSRESVRIRCVVPACDTYWSISLYAWNTDNFFVLNDRDSKSREFDLVIVGPKRSHQKKENEEAVAAPTKRGVIVVRAVVKDRENLDEISQIEESLNRTAIVPYSQAADAASRHAAG